MPNTEDAKVEAIIKREETRLGRFVNNVIDAGRWVAGKLSIWEDVREFNFRQELKQGIARIKASERREAEYARSAAHIRGNQHNDYAEARADMAGDATLSWRLEREDPREILADVRRQVHGRASPRSADIKQRVNGLIAKPSDRRPDVSRSLSR